MRDRAVPRRWAIDAREFAGIALLARDAHKEDAVAVPGGVEVVNRPVSAPGEGKGEWVEKFARKQWSPVLMAIF